MCIFLAASGATWSRGWYAAAVVTDTTGIWPAEVSCRDGDAAVAIATAMVPAAVRPPPTGAFVVFVLALFVDVPLEFDVAGATVTLSKPAVAVVVVVPTDVVPTVAGEVTAVDRVALAEFAAVVAVAVEEEEQDDDSSDATIDEGDAADCSVSSGGLGGGVAKLDQHVDGELLLDVTLLAQSKPTSTSTRVDHVVSHGDSDRVGEDDTYGSSFR